MLSDEIRKLKKDLVNRVALANAEFVNLARDYTPLGVDETLRKSISTLKPIVTQNRIRTIATAYSLNGAFNYAEYQHNTILRHLNPPNSVQYKSFKDYGQGGDSRLRYQRGYEARKTSAYKYALKFFERAGKNEAFQRDYALILEEG